MKNLLKSSLIIILVLSGCSGKSVSTESITNIIEGSTTVTGQVADTSSVKEALGARRWIEFYKAQVSIHENSGTKVKFKMMEVKPGVFVQTMDTVEMRQILNLPKPPDHPSVHPVWNFAEVSLKVLAKYGLIGYGINQFAGVWETSMSQAGTYSPVNSHNVVRGDNFVESQNPLNEIVEVISAP